MIGHFDEGWGRVRDQKRGRQGCEPPLQYLSFLFPSSPACAIYIAGAHLQVAFSGLRPHDKDLT